MRLIDSAKINEPTDLARTLGPDGILGVLTIMYDSYIMLKEKDIVTYNMPEDRITEEWFIYILQEWESKNLPYVPVHKKPVWENHKGKGKPPEIDFCFRDKAYSESYFAVECKLLDEGDNTHMNYYIGEGVVGRYLSCKYAKNNSAGSMVGYVRVGEAKIVADRLKQAIGDLSGKAKLERNDVIKGFCDIYVSKHGRKGGVSPFDIYHLLFQFNCVKN